MTITESEHAALAHFYQVLGIPPSSTAGTIKKAYRQLAKRWHPDLYRAGTQQYAAAIEMMKRINEAYEAIQHAPLRYAPRVVSSPTYTQAPAGFRKWESQITPQFEARVEFWTRFIFGALFGALMAFRLMLNWYRNPAGLIIASLALVIGCGLAAVKLGDDFWYLVLPRR